MTCEDCLSALKTESLRDLTPDSPLMQHCATCPDCARVTTALRDREYETATILNGLPPMSNPLTVADSAVRTAQRRRVGRVAVMISGAALAVTLWIVAVTIVIPALEDGDSVARSTLHTETMQLSCLSPQQAADIISPYVRSRGSIYYVPSSGIGAITVRGTLGELSNARDIIRDFESDPSAACRLPMTIVKRLQDQMSGDQGRSGDEPAVAADKATTSLLGTPGKSLLDQGPSGSGPVTAPKKATPPPKKQ